MGGLLHLSSPSSPCVNNDKPQGDNDSLEPYKAASAPLRSRQGSSPSAPAQRLGGHLSLHVLRLVLVVLLHLCCLLYLETVPIARFLKGRHLSGHDDAVPACSCRDRAVEQAAAPFRRPPILYVSWTRGSSDLELCALLVGGNQGRRKPELVANSRRKLNPFLVAE
ncbi:hypothetical protein CRG98_000340 [Punica granatum]|uniref:Uncharacterized protein n=1 Tax=Punica granatum TaxID=22663 RepID=A0A2I0LF03_PUNGR|nr:hypothetical protein CRG98_000340 [Punica granatum]